MLFLGPACVVRADADAAAAAAAASDGVIWCYARRVLFTPPGTVRTRRKNPLVTGGGRAVFMFSVGNENIEFLLLPVNVYRYQRPCLV